MTTKYKNLCKAFLCTTVSLAALCNVANASVVKITNHLTEIEVMIEPGNGKWVGTAPEAMKFKLPGNETKEVTVKEEEMGQKTFTVTGKITVVGKCEGLSVDKDYDITFANGKMGGITCTATERK